MGQNIHVVYNGGDDKKRESNQHILHRHRQAQAEDAGRLVPLNPKGTPLKIKGEVPAAEYRQGQGQAHPLGSHGGEGGPRRPQAEHSHQQKIPHDVDDAGHQHEVHGPLGVPQAPEHAADHIVAGDEHQAAGADKQVLPGGRRRGGHLHQRHDGVGGQGEGGRQDHGDEGKEGKQGADGPVYVLPPPGAQVLPHQHRTAGGQADNKIGHRLHDLAAGGHGGDARLVGKLSHHDQVHRAVQKLQQGSTEEGDGKAA